MEPHRPPVSWSTAAAIVVFAIAVTVRMPSCYESFWLDELHSAWTVWGDLSEVAPRADAGHQSPLYFFGLWFWKQVFGGSEVGLRLSSVLATALACAVLTLGVTRWTKSVLAGATSGLILAIESNSIFFGTELRPYAFVILVASIVQVCFLRLVDSKSRFELPLLWSVLIVSILVAGLTQPTALGVLMLFPIVLLGRWSIHDRRELTRFGMLDAFLLVGAVTTAIALWRSTLGESWQGRSQWAAFGSAKNFRQIMQVWDWWWLLIAPLAVTSVAAVISKRSATGSLDRRWLRTVLVLSLIATAATGVYWLISWLEWAPIWHRRYFVAVLPVFATVGGGAVGAVQHMIASSRQATTLAMVAATLLLCGLGLHQGTLQALRHYPVALAVRGEDWRAAVHWVNENMPEGDHLYMDPDLIEAKNRFPVEIQRSPSTGAQVVVVGQLTPAMAEYFRFPLSGPYKVDREVRFINAEQLGALLLDANGPLVTTVPDSQTGRHWIIVRGKPGKLAGQRRRTETMVRFGGVSVIIKASMLDHRS